MSQPAFLTNYPDLQNLYQAAQVTGNWQAKCRLAERLLTLQNDQEFNQQIIYEAVAYFNEILNDPIGQQSSYANDANLQLGLLAHSENNLDVATRLFQAVKFDVTNPMPFFEAQNQLVSIHLNKTGGQYNHLHALAAYKKVLNHVSAVNVDVFPKHINILIIKAIQANQIKPSYTEELKNEYFYKMNRLEFHFGIISLDQYQDQLTHLAFSSNSSDKLKVKAFYQLIITSIQQAQKSNNAEEIARYFDKALAFAETFNSAKDLNALGKKALQINYIILPALRNAKADGVITNPGNLWSSINKFEGKLRYGLEISLKVLATLASLALYLNPIIFAIAIGTYWFRAAFSTKPYNPKHGVVWDFITEWGLNLAVPFVTKILTPTFLILGFCVSFIAKSIYELVTNNPGNLKTGIDNILATKINMGNGTYTSLTESLRSVTNSLNQGVDNQPKIGVNDIFHQLFQPAENTVENPYPNIDNLNQNNNDDGYQTQPTTLYPQ